VARGTAGGIGIGVLTEPAIGKTNLIAVEVISGVTGTVLVGLAEGLAWC